MIRKSPNGGKERAINRMMIQGLSVKYISAIRQPFERKYEIRNF
jgi:hypothetical protein